jgi:hypothetical protein
MAGHDLFELVWEKVNSSKAKRYQEENGIITTAETK